MKAPLMICCTSAIKLRRIRGGARRAGTSSRLYAGDETAQTVEFLRYANMQEPRFLKKGISVKLRAA